MCRSRHTKTYRYTKGEIIYLKRKENEFKKNNNRVYKLDVDYCMKNAFLKLEYHYPFYYKLKARDSKG